MRILGPHHHFGRKGSFPKIASSLLKARERSEMGRDIWKLDGLEGSLRGNEKPFGRSESRPGRSSGYRVKRLVYLGNAHLCAREYLRRGPPFFSTFFLGGGGT